MPQTWCFTLSVYHQEACDMWHECLIIGDTYFVHMVVSARLLHCKVTFFPFVINWYLVQDT